MSRPQKEVRFSPVVLRGHEGEYSLKYMCNQLLYRYCLGCNRCKQAPVPPKLFFLRLPVGQYGKPPYPRSNANIAFLFRAQQQHFLAGAGVGRREYVKQCAKTLNFLFCYFAHWACLFFALKHANVALQVVGKGTGFQFRNLKAKDFQQEIEVP